MRCYKVVLTIALCCVSAAAQSQTLDDITPESCRALLPEPETVLRELVTSRASSSAFSLLVEAVQRHCAAIGEIVIDATGKIDPTRSVGEEVLAADRADQLAREAKYYLETAMQIDPDASNDLLRRLLGNEPRPSK